MDIRTYRARTMHEALALVRRELGPDAAVLHTREVNGDGLVGWLKRRRVIEVTASASVQVPSRLPQRVRPKQPAPAEPAVRAAPSSPKPPQTSGRLDPAHLERDYRAKFRDDVKCQLGDVHSMVEDLSRRSSKSPRPELPEALFHLFTEMIEADLSEDLARELIERAVQGGSAGEADDPLRVREQLVRLVEEEIHVCGPIRPVRGQRRLIALVGPTGVGKTTTIAKLAANFRLRDKLRVGLITVDTYRIAAVDQLRTYADIIDLPMEVVSTPREMRAAAERMSDMDLVLMDTAGRSPRDEVKVQELKSMLAEADADEVHLVLSGVAGASNLANTASKFAEVGTTALILTKLDEAAGLGNLLPALRVSRLPLSYLTHGQNVPDDIVVAERGRLASMMIGGRLAYSG